LKTTLLAAATALVLSACATGTVDPSAAMEAEQAAPAAGDAQATRAARRYGTWGIDTAGMNPEVDPGDDFFEYVSGQWADTTEIPADRSSYSSFAVLRDLSEARVRALVEGYPQVDPATGGDAAKVAALYHGFMDEAAIEALGDAPLQRELDALRAIDDKAALAARMGTANSGFASSFFGAYVTDDQKNPDTYALYLSQSGLGLGDRQMYLDEKFAPQRERYVEYIAQLLELAGWDDPRQHADDIMAMETRIAEAHWTRAESRDRDKTYNPVALDDMDTFAPGFPWSAYFAAAGVDAATQAVVR
jgi:putative endopeptidase